MHFSDNKPPFAVLFDMDGVIIDSNPYHKKALDIFLAAKGFHLDETERKTRLYGRANKDWINDLYQGRLDAEELHILGAEKETIWREVYEAHIKPLPGLVDFLKALQQDEIPYCIGTSAPPENVHFTLQKLKLYPFFTTILHQDHVVKGKPDPEIYINCAKALRMAPQSCVVVEDSLSGVQAGISAGCKVVAVTTTHAAHEFSAVDLIIQDFTELTVEDLFNLFLKLS